MAYKGKAHKFGDDINTDEIIPARYLNTTNKEDLAKHCMEDIDKEFTNKIAEGDIIVAGENFGCGSSREHAPISIKAAGLSCIVAKSFARIFFRNCINTGLILPLETQEDPIRYFSTKDNAEVDIEKRVIKNLDKPINTIPFNQFGEIITKIIEVGGLINYIKKDLQNVK